MFRKTVFVLLLSIPALFGQGRPPGPPPAPAPLTGAPLPGLSPSEMALFLEGLNRFREVDSVSGTQPGATGSGLGPRFNLNSCAGCHAQPATGGSSPQVNPQIAVASAYGAANTIPAFIQANGPVRAVRFALNPDGTPDGAVHDLFTIAGRGDAVGCTIQQPDFATAVAQNNAFFRIPIPLFGAGLIEAIDDATILANKSANSALKAQFGIAGHENRSPNDGTIARFGWKAQNKSLMLFAGEAYNVEQGVTNEIFPAERDETPGCGFNTTPEDFTDVTQSTVLASISDVTGFAAFMRFLAPPAPVPAINSPSAVNGRHAFTQVGCALCHTPVLTTGNATSPALNNKPVVLYSDLLVHQMGTGLADGIVQGLAQGGEFRTAPLWGLSQRLFLLHDGRTSDLGQAIQMHAGSGSEANGSVAAFNALPAATQQDIVNFLQSL